MPALGRRGWRDPCKLTPSPHQALLTTAEDGPADEHRAPLSPGPGFGGGLNSKMTVPSSPGTALSGPHSYLSHGSRLVVQFLI